MIKNIKLGADPELFLENDLEIISAEGLIGGTKEKPKDVPGYPGFYIQEDNIMVEFNIPPASSSEDYQDNIETMLDYVEEVGRVYHTGISNLASANINPMYLRTEQARTFGCEPDINVYTGEENQVSSHDARTLRTCGGHIHVGYDNPTKNTSALLIAAMDVTLGLASLSMDKDDRRRQLYGNAGALRFKDYGVEYRTLSNFWIFNRKTVNWAWEGTMAAIGLVNSGLMPELQKEYGELVQECIDKNNKTLANTLLINISKFLKTKKTCAEFLDTQGLTLKK